MEIGLIEIGLKQLLARKICNYVDRIDKITTCSIVNTNIKKYNKKTQKRIKHGTKFKFCGSTMKVVQK